jgi:hypothetical protein
MDEAEMLANKYLVAQGFNSIIHEPDGNVPPDFAVEKQIAVEVRRLEWTLERGGRREGLNALRAPMLEFFLSLFDELGAPTGETSWFVVYRFQRPINKKRVRREARRILTDFMKRPTPGRHKFQVDTNFELEIFPSTVPHDTFYLIGMIADHDAGGFVVAHMATNIRSCIEEMK